MVFLWVDTEAADCLHLQDMEQHTQEAMVVPILPQDTDRIHQQVDILPTMEQFTLHPEVMVSLTLHLERPRGTVYHAPPLITESLMEVFLHQLEDRIRHQDMEVILQLIFLREAILSLHLDMDHILWDM